MGRKWFYTGSIRRYNYYAGGKIKEWLEYTKFNGVLPALGVSIGYAF